MVKKADVSFPMALLVTIILVAVVILIAVFFMWGSSEKIKGMLEPITKTMMASVKAALGPLGQLLIGG